MATRQISLLVDSPLRTLALALRDVVPELRKQISSRTKAAAEPIWFEEVRGRALTRLQQRTLVDSARVGVTSRNVFLRSGAVGTLSSGTPVSMISAQAEFGALPGRVVQSHSKKGTAYTRKLGDAFGPRRRGGNAVYQAASDSIVRMASLWIQTARRTLFDAIETGSK